MSKKPKQGRPRKKKPPRKKKAGKRLTKAELAGRQSVGARIGHVRRMAREAGIDPDQIMFKKGDRWYAGKMLLENDLPQSWKDGLGKIQDEVDVAEILAL